MTFMKCSKYEIGESDEISLLSLIRMDPTITDAFDGLQLYIEAVIISSGTGSTNSADEGVF